MPAEGRHREGTRRQRAACREGRHLLGPGQPIGGGIFRSTCQACGSVTIDISDAEDEPRPTGLFGADRMAGPILDVAVIQPRRNR